MERRLRDEQRAELYRVVAECYNAQRGNRRKTRRAVRQKLVGLGWDTILINLVLPIVITLIRQWIEDRLSQAPPQMPATFASELIERPQE